MSEEKKIDWEKIESEYRAGILSLREIAALHGNVNHVAIARKAKKENWVRDLSEKIHSRAEELVTKRAVTDDVTEKRAVSDKAVVEANAEVIARIRLGHRKDIARSRNVAMELLGEIEAQTINAQLFEELGEMLRSDDEKGVDKRNDLYMKVISSSGRIDSMKKLSDTLKTLIGLEREAYGLASEESNKISEGVARTLSDFYKH